MGKARVAFHFFGESMDDVCERFVMHVFMFEDGEDCIAVSGVAFLKRGENAAVAFGDKSFHRAAVGPRPDRKTARLYAIFGIDTAPKQVLKVLVERFFPAMKSIKC